MEIDRAQTAGNTYSHLAEAVYETKSQIPCTAFCHGIHSGGLDVYEPVMIGSHSIAAMVLNNATIKGAMSVLDMLEDDDYLRFTSKYCKEGIKKFGEHWAYADIATTLFGISQILHPTAYLEVGVRRGRSMAMVASQSTDCLIVGFDIWKANYAGMPNPGQEFVRRELQKVGYKGHASFIDGNSHETLKKYFKDNPEKFFDLITVDGDHTAEGAAEDLADVMPYLKIGGVVLFDDIVHPSHLYLYDIWKHATRDKTRFTTWEFTELGYGVAVAIRRA